MTIPPGPSRSIERIPDDVAVVAARLDRLGALDGTNPGLEERVQNASVDALRGLDDAHARAEMLAFAERASADAGLEHRVAGASATLLLGGAPAGKALRLAGDGPVRVTIRRRTWLASGWARSLAAVLLVSVGGVVMWRALDVRDAASPPARIATDEIASRLDEDFDILYSAMSDLSMVEDSDSTSGSIDELLDEGAS